MSEVVLTIDTGGFLAHLDGIAANVARAVPAAAIKGGELVKAKAVAGAPVRSGHLRGSAELRVFGGFPTLMVRVRFPGPYARRQHFELGWRHPHGGHALYLYLAQAQSGSAVIDLIDQAVKGAL